MFLVISTCPCTLKLALSACTSDSPTLSLAGASEKLYTCLSNIRLDFLEFIWNGIHDSRLCWIPGNMVHLCRGIMLKCCHLSPMKGSLAIQCFFHDIHIICCKLKKLGKNKVLRNRCVVVCYKSIYFILSNTGVNPLNSLIAYAMSTACSS